MTREFGLIGRSLKHSFSKGYFTTKFHALHIDAVYELFELGEVGEWRGLWERHPRLEGLNVTIPFKEAVVPLLDSLSPVAAAVGAVNCIDLRGGRAVGHNTDVIGFRDALAEVYDAPPGGNALILGTGGAAKAVHHALAHYYQFEEIHFATRAPQAAAHRSYEALRREGLGGYRLLVNTTPLGMYPALEGMPDLALETLQPGTLVYDLIYNPEETQLLAAARAQGLPTANGMDMLIRQAEASWVIWNLE